MSELNPAKPRSLARRQFLQTTGRAGLAAWAGGRAAIALGREGVSLPFENGERPLATFPQKRPLILLTTRPPQLETPFAVFNEGILTPNDAFFVRYHLAQIPTAIDPDKFSLAVTGKVASPLTLGIKDLKTQFEALEMVAVNQCSGNGRG